MANMNYVDHLDLFGVPAKEIPCIKFEGPPTESTVGAVGLLGMDTLTGDVWKCVSETNGIYEWEYMESSPNVEPYITTREELTVGYELINTEYIHSLYDALVEEYPNKIQKNEVYNDDNTFINYEYVISTGEHNGEGKGVWPGRDTDIKKPKYLILSGIHGTERPGVLSVYRFVKDLLAGKNTITTLLEGAVIHILPVGTPWGISNFMYENANGVNINRNFTAEVFEKETQAIAGWLEKHSDAELFIDVHNSGQVNEVMSLLGVADNPAVDIAKKVALRGLDRIIPYWRDVIKYNETLLCWKSSTDSTEIEKKVIFSYSASVDIPESAIQYALDEHGITSLALETSVYQNGNYSDYKKNEKACTPETVAAGAEALGNILTEFYEQSFFCGVADNMTNIDNKLDMLLEMTNSGFRTESGVYEVAADEQSASGVQVKIPCTNGAKLLTFQADADTYAEIEKTTGVYWTLGVFGNCVTKIGSWDDRGYMSRMAPKTSDQTQWIPHDAGVYCYNTDGFWFKTAGIKKGKYNWTAYYWND